MKWMKAIVMTAIIVAASSVMFAGGDNKGCCRCISTCKKDGVCQCACDTCQKDKNCKECKCDCDVCKPAKGKEKCEK